ncbi:MAG: hypothetical protein HQ553_09445 [Chloroflexi bacterium]|nr:hypothetical protein [Chloroflexota bacterium]
MTTKTDSSPDTESIEKTTMTEAFICNADELEQLVRYYTNLIADLKFNQNPQYEWLIKGDIDVQAAIESRIEKIAEIIEKDVTDDIVEKTTNEFDRKIGAEFDRGYTGEAVSRLREYRRRCCGE